jgi:uroporphyrinogen decarboxylase
MSTDGIYSVVPYNQMSPGAKKVRDCYAMKPDAGIYQMDHGLWFVLNKWIKEGHIPDIRYTKGDTAPEGLLPIFGYDPPGNYYLNNLGFCEAAFSPAFEEKILEDLGDYEIAQDYVGRKVKYFKNRRSGFMPEYIGHPVKDMHTWEEKCLWRMDPKSSGRIKGIQDSLIGAKRAVAEGQVITLDVVGGYMYLRSLMGPLETMYLLYDDPDLIRACMYAWFELADYVSAEFQKHVTIDEVLLGEDICYNHGFLISDDMIREFLFPWYTQLLSNIRSRQLDKGRRLYFHVDTDGFSDVAIPVYQEIGLDFLHPFEVASGCDVVRTGKEYPNLLIRGGFDKRIIAKGKEAIDREIDRIMPVMKHRGGYIPTCDHGVPEEVAFEDYMYYRKRMLEFA